VPALKLAPSSAQVILVDTESPAAHDALLTAGHRGNADRPEEILAASGIPAPRSGR